MLEVTGHDHLGDLRYSDQKYSNDTNGTNYSFHNIIVGPALTYRSYSMGGYTVFKVDPETLTPNSLKMVFLPINATKGAHPSKQQPMFRIFDYQYFGVTDLTVQSMTKLK